MVFFWLAFFFTEVKNNAEEESKPDKNNNKKTGWYEGGGGVQVELIWDTNQWKNEVIHGWPKKEKETWRWNIV